MCAECGLKTSATAGTIFIAHTRRFTPPRLLASDLDTGDARTAIWSPRCSNDGQPTYTADRRGQHLPCFTSTSSTFRFNRRDLPSPRAAVYRLLQQAAGTDPHPLSELIGGTGNDWDELTND